jgi:hypothetical protein
MDRGNLKDLLAGLIDRIEYSPASPTCQIQLRIQLGGDKVASPRGFERVISTISLPREAWLQAA